jgi:transposase
VTADGAIPLDYQVWSGRTADKATVESNMTRLAALLQAQGWSPQQVLLVGDSANVDDRLVLLYDRLQIRYLASVPLVKAAHRQLVADVPEAAFYRQALVADSQQDGYWGVSVPVSFEHEGRRVHHRGLVVLSGPMRSALAQTRAQHFRALWAALREVQAKASQGARRYRTAKAVLARAQTQLRASPVGQLVTVTATGAPGAVQLHWQVQREALVQAMHQDGRYLLVTNDPDLTPAEMLQHYRQKDGAEKNFLVCKRDIRVSPIYLHQDQRIQAMLLLNMLALLAYRILERQLRQSGLALTTRRLIQQLESLCVIETHCWDGSVLLRLTPLSPQQAQLVRWLATMVPLCAAAYVSAPPHDRGYVPPWPLLLAC